MIFWAFISLAVAVTSGLFGFGGEATPVAGMAQTLFFVFLAIAILLAGYAIANSFDSDERSRND